MSAVLLLAEWKASVAGFAVWFIIFTPSAARSGTTIWRTLFVLPVARSGQSARRCCPHLAICVARCRACNGRCGLEHSSIESTVLALKCSTSDPVQGRRPRRLTGWRKESLMEMSHRGRPPINGVIARAGRSWRLKTEFYCSASGTHDTGKPVVWAARLISLRTAAGLGNQHRFLTPTCDFRKACAVVTTSAGRRPRQVATATHCGFSPLEIAPSAAVRKNNRKSTRSGWGVPTPGNTDVHARLR